MSDTTTARSAKNVALVPTTRLACSRFCAPIAWPTRIDVAIPMPNTRPMRKKKIVFAFDVAVSAALPR